MPRASLESTVSVASRALALVEDGWSERGAIRSALKQSPDARDRREIFRLVIETLARKSLVDRVIQIVLGKIPTSNDRLSLARLSVTLFLLTRDIDRRDALNAIRASCSPSFRPQLEKLIGDLVTKDSQEEYAQGTRENEKIGLLLGYPEWWVEYCIHVWGRSEALDILRGTGIRPRYLHVNPLRSNGISESQLLSLQGLEPVPELSGFYRVMSEGLSGEVREHVENGILEGQDLAAYLAVKAGEPTENDTVLDVCAAPGGKTGALSQLMGNKGWIVAVDYSRGRMRDWKRMVNTLGVTNASGLAEDATRLGFKKDSLFDLVLVDPPCSGSGIFEKNPAMKWHLSPQRQSKYHNLQYNLLQDTSKFLKPDGRIIYSTCSISVEENEGVIDRFLSRNPDFETRPILDGWGHPGLQGHGKCRRFYPYLDQTSGYFIARLERIN